MDAQTTAALNSLQAQISNLMSQGSREGAFAPSTNDPYVVPGPRDFYSYTQRTAIAGGVGITTSATYQIEADSYFYMNGLSYMTDQALADTGGWTLILAPLVTVVMFDSGSGRQLMANPTPLNNIASAQSGVPFRLPKPRRFAPTSQITVTFVNYSANAYNISLTLSGFKVYANQAITVNGPVGT